MCVFGVRFLLMIGASLLLMTFCDYHVEYASSMVLRQL